MKLIGENVVLPELPIIPVTNIHVNYSSGQYVGKIHWVPVDTLVTITADIGLLDSEFMVMFEYMVNSDEVIKDVRRPASIVDGLMTLQVLFKDTGNPVLSSDRLNKGLSIIGAPFRLADFRIEFDVYDVL